MPELHSTALSAAGNARTSCSASSISPGLPMPLTNPRRTPVVIASVIAGCP
ncbi:Uncharacterised protein [Mycobacteroides abscessus subsp. abscessus]|nr:Uncharacterised protein [Mycobacteroides abscessus subsp. abscessus]